MRDGERVGGRTRRPAAPPLSGVLLLAAPPPVGVPLLAAPSPLRVPLLLGALLLAVVLGGCAGGGRGATPTLSNAAGVVTSASLPRSVPLSIDIPKIGVRSTLLALDDSRHRGVQLPSASTPMQAGWFSGGPAPGQIGPAAIFGRVSAHHQPAVFARLYDLVAGDPVLVKLQDGSTATFRVTHVEQLSKGSFATDAVHGDTTDAELRLVTCGDTFDPASRSFRDNIIVFATLVTH
ncbi:MAG TPA: sortase [Pseudonocardiaceae bacterium]